MMTMDTAGFGRPAMSREEGRLLRNDSYDTLSTSATTNSDASTFDGGSGSLKSTSRRRSRQAPAPRGLLNLGNTCYANAALQCLFATALPHALLDHKKAAVFRRYASNGDLLALGAGSADSFDDEDWIGGVGSGDDGGGSAVGMALDDGPTTKQQAAADDERRKRREERRTRREARLKEQEKKAQRELCQWLTLEMTELTRNFTAAPRKSKPADNGGFFGSIFGSGSSSPPQRDAVDPGNITRNVHKLCRTLRPYQQEDAHEFLRALLSGLVMEGQNRKLSALFDGLLESAVTCQTCRYTSLTRDRYMDLSLDIADRSVTDLPQALRNFTKTELLDEDNMVECGRCKEKRVVSKGLRLATAPTVLVVQLKRFAFDMYGRMTRLNKDVKYPLRLEIGKYMSKANRATPPPYELVGVLVHSGRTCDSGHYLSYVKSGRKWYKANDSVVSEVSEDVAMNQKPYILVYEVAGMKARHGCDSYHRYHRKEERSSSRRNEVVRGDSAQSSSPRRKDSARAQSAPRPIRHGDDEGAPPPAHERGNSDDLNAARSRSRGRPNRREPEDSTDCFAFSSLLGLLELCGNTTYVEDEGGDQQKYMRHEGYSSSPVQASGTSRNLEDKSSMPTDEVFSSPADKDLIDMPPPSLPLPRRKKSSPNLSPAPSSPGSARRLRRSASSGSARDLELNAARAYRKSDGIRKRASMAAENEVLTTTEERDSSSQHRSCESLNSVVESDCDSTASGAATEILVGSKGGHHHHRRVKSLSRFVHRRASKAAGAALHHSGSTSQQQGRILGGSNPNPNPFAHRTPPGISKGKGLRLHHQHAASGKKSRSRGSEGNLPPLPNGK